jgi:flagellar biosynthesis/type III secretory pathway protein FliH
MMGRVVVGELSDAAERSRRILSEAKQQAAELRAEFERNMDLTRNDMMIQARADAEIEVVTKALEIAALRQRTLDQTQDDIMTLAQVMAERVIGEELLLKPERLMYLAQKSIREARGSSRMVLYAHPDDAAYLTRALDILTTDGSAEIRIQAEPEFAPGDIRIETDVGTLDARIGTQIANLAAKIRESLRV